MATFANDYALVVGIDHYPSFRSLTGPSQDAKDFDTWLINTETGGGVPKENRRLLLSTKEPIKPLQDEIDEALAELLALVKNGTARRFYLYFSGHGLARKRLGADLCLAKWSRLFRNYALDSEDYFNMLVGTGKFTEIICLFDCCRVRMTNAVGQPSRLGFPRDEDNAGSNRSLIGYATEYQNAAFEALSSEEDGEYTRGYFTKALLEALTGAAAVAGGGVPASKLKAFVEGRTLELSRLDEKEQTPEVFNGFNAEFEPVFGSALPNRRVVVSFSAERRGHLILVVDGNDRTVYQSNAGEESWELRLAGGLYMLVDTVTGDEKSIREGVSDVRF